MRLQSLVLFVAAFLSAPASPALIGQARPGAEATAAIAIDLDARSFQPGEVVLVTVTTTSPADRVRVRAQGRELTPWRVDAVTWRALAGLDLDIAPGPYAVVVNVGSEHAARDVVITPKAFRTRTLEVDETFVNPPASVQPRIEREAKRLAGVWQQSAASRLWTGRFLPPVPQPANSAFGSRSIFNGQPRSPHGGADFASPTGTPVKSPGGGRIVLAGNLFYTGNTVIVDHGLGLFSLMAHLSEIAVRENADVAAGDLLGLVGATGRVTGPHLHWTVRLAGARVDPVALMATVHE